MVLISPTARKLLFGLFAGLAAGFVTYPNDTIRRILQIQTGSVSPRQSASLQCSGYVDCVVQILRQPSGLFRLYRGLGTNLIRMGPNTAIQFAAFDSLKRLSIQLRESDE